MHPEFYAPILSRKLFSLFLFSCTLWAANAQTFDGADPLNKQTNLVQTATAEDISNAAMGLPRKDMNRPTPDAMWDIQFKFAQNDSLPLGFTPRVYGLTWTGTEFWGTPWNSATANYMDTIIRYDRTGRYLGVLRMKNSSGMRCMTVLNGAVWASNAVDSIYKISLQTGEVIKKVKTQTVGGVRFITADSTGKLWVGNFTTPIWQIDTNGTIFQTIPIAAHGMSGMSGAAYDGISPGGPYLWINNQTSQTVGAPAGTYIRILKISPTVSPALERNVAMDVPDVGTSIAGTMTIARLPGFSRPSLISLSQNGGGAATGRVVAYELDFRPPQVAELGVDSPTLVGGYTIVPKVFSPGIAFTARVNNRGFANTPTGSQLNVDLMRGANILATRNAPVNVNSFASQMVSVGNFGNITVGNYDAFYFASASGDPFPNNDSTRTLFTVSDSTMGRDLLDRGLAFTAWGPGGGQGGNPRRIGTTYTFPSQSTINSVTMFYRSANANDSLHIAIFKMVNGRPTDSIGGSAIHVTTVDDVVGIRRTFRLKAPVTVNANETVLITSTDDGRGAHFVLTTTNILPLNSCWVYRQAYLSGTTSLATAWYSDTVTIGAAVQRRGFVIRPNLNNRVGTTDLTGNIEKLTLMPNPTDGALHLSLELAKADKARLDILDIAGRVVHTEGVMASPFLEKDLSLHHLTPGFYILKMTTESGGQIVKRFVKQ